MAPPLESLVAEYNNVGQAPTRTEAPVKSVTGEDMMASMEKMNDEVVDKLRQKPISSKNINAWIQDYNNLSTKMEQETYRNFQRNQALIDLSRVPQSKKDVIINTYDSTKTHLNILNYLITKRCGLLIECAEDFNTL